MYVRAVAVDTANSFGGRGGGVDAIYTALAMRLASPALAMYFGGILGLLMQLLPRFFFEEAIRNCWCFCFGHEI